MKTEETKDFTEGEAKRGYILDPNSDWPPQMKTINQPEPLAPLEDKQVEEELWEQLRLLANADRWIWNDDKKFNELKSNFTITRKG